MPEGKPAGVRCVQLTDELRCAIFGSPDRPNVCLTLRKSEDLCGASRDDALELIASMERTTAPVRSSEETKRDEAPRAISNFAPLLHATVAGVPNGSAGPEVTGRTWIQPR